MIGVDVVDVERLRRVLDGSPRVTTRMFTPAEIEYCSRASDPAVHFAGTLAAKEATVKALGLSSLLEWSQRITVTRDDSGAPFVSIAAHPERVSVSISHDGGVAVSVALRNAF